MKKAFFKEASKAQIARKTKVKVASLADIVNLKAGEFTIVDAFTPEGYKDARKFMKHGEEVRVRRFRSSGEAVRYGKTPVQLREDAFDAIRGNEFCGYSFMPFARDRRKRKVSLTACLEGARLFAYSHQVRGAGIKMKAYADARRARIEGAEAVASVPSRTEGHDRHKFKLMAVPIVDIPEKYALAFNLGSDHACGAKRFNIRYRYLDDKESSGVVNFCSHEVAVYLELVQREWEQNKNIVPLQMCMFAIPSQRTVDFYLRLENNVLIKDKAEKGKEALRKPNLAEKEIALWEFVRQYGHDAAFFPKSSRDGSLRKYRWQVE